MRLDRRERVLFDLMMTSRCDRNAAQCERNRSRFGHLVHVLLELEGQFSELVWLLSVIRGN